MNYLLSFILIACLVSCHQSQSPLAKNDTRQLVTDTSVNQDLIASPEEMMDDSIFTDGSKPSSWSVTGINDPNQLKIFIKFLRLWIKQGNKDSIASHVQFPLANNKNISSTSEFLKNYDQLFNAKVIAAINNQRLSQLFRNQHGVMLGNGELWIKNVSNNKTDDFKITTINN